MRFDIVRTANVFANTAPLKTVKLTSIVLYNIATHLKFSNINKHILSFK